jgi:hypothetical protein
MFFHARILRKTLRQTRRTFFLAMWFASSASILLSLMLFPHAPSLPASVLSNLRLCMEALATLCFSHSLLRFSPKCLPSTSAHLSYKTRPVNLLRAYPLGHKDLSITRLPFALAVCVYRGLPFVLAVCPSRASR